MGTDQSFEDVCRSVSVNPDSDCAAVQNTAKDVVPWVQILGIAMLVLIIAGVIWLVVSQAKRAKHITGNSPDKPPHIDL